MLVLRGLRRWLGELHNELDHVRSAHDALRHRYDRDLELVAGNPGIEGERGG